MHTHPAIALGSIIAALEQKFSQLRILAHRQPQTKVLRAIEGAGGGCIKGEVQQDCGILSETVEQDCGIIQLIVILHGNVVINTLVCALTLTRHRHRHRHGHGHGHTHTLTHTLTWLLKARVTVPSWPRPCSWVSLSTCARARISRGAVA